MNKKLIATAVAAGMMSISGLAQATDYEVTVTNITAGQHFTPLILATHAPSAHMFVVGESSSTQLQAIAEGGDISGMAELLESIGANVAPGGGLVAPGASESFTISTTETNSVFSMSAMLLPTNDGFVGLDSIHLPTGAGESMTFYAAAYDAGTEANDELQGSGAPGEPGYPVPPPLAATGLLGSGGTGVNTTAEGIVHPHRGVIGDLDATGGFSDINAAAHRWADPVARVTVTVVSGGSAGGDDAALDDGGNSDAATGPAVSGLNAIAYSSTAVEIFWDRNDSAVSYEVRRDGESVAALDGQSFYESSLNGATEYTYSVRAIDANGNAGEYAMVSVSTN